MKNPENADFNRRIGRLFLWMALDFVLYVLTLWGWTITIVQVFVDGPKLTYGWLYAGTLLCTVARVPVGEHVDWLKYRLKGASREGVRPDEDGGGGGSLQRRVGGEPPASSWRFLPSTVCEVVGALLIVGWLVLLLEVGLGPEGKRWWLYGGIVLGTLTVAFLRATGRLRCGGASMEGRRPDRDEEGEGDPLRGEGAQESTQR